MPVQERRRNPRVKLNELAYINLDSGNGGIVLDVSRGGFGLQLAAPLVDMNTIRFRLSISEIDEVEATGEVVWKDITRKRIGVRVTHLPVEIRKQVQTWLGTQPQTSSEWRAALAGAEIPVKTLATDEIASGLSERNNMLSAEKAEAASSPGQSFYTGPNPISETGGLPQGPIESDAERFRPPLYKSHSMFFPSEATTEEYGEPVSSRHPLTYAALILTLALGVYLGVVGYIHKRETGEILSRLGEKISGHSRSEPVKPISPPAAAQVGDGLPANGNMVANQTNTQDRSAEEIPQAPPAAGKETSRGDSAKANRTPVDSYEEDSGQPDLTLARKYLRERSGSGSAGVAEQLLWSAIKKGSVEAEVELAELYVSGDRLPKNCEQARVLFRAASNANNTLAA